MKNSPQDIHIHLTVEATLILYLYTNFLWPEGFIIVSTGAYAFIDIEVEKEQLKLDRLKTIAMDISDSKAYIILDMWFQNSLNHSATAYKEYVRYICVHLLTLLLNYYDESIQKYS